MPVRVKVVGPNGEKGTLPASSMSEAVKKGWRQAGQFEDDEGGAAAVGYLRGATAGLSDPLITGIHDLTGGALGQSKETLAGLKRDNPDATTAGEVGGNVMGAIAGGAGPVGLISKAGNAARTAVGGGRLLGGVASGVVEGGLYGLGNVISESSIGDPQTNAQKLAAVTGGALFGGGLGVATHALGAGASAVVNKLGGGTLKEALDSLAEKSLWTQISSKKVLRNRNLLGQESEISRYALDNGMVPGLGSSEEFAKRIEAHRNELGAARNDILDKASSREVTGLDGQPVRQTIAGGFDGLRLERRVKEELLDGLRRDPGAKSSVDKIEGYLADLNSQKGGYTLKEADELQSKVNKAIGMGDVQGLKENMRSFRNIFRDEIHDQAADISPHYGEQLKDLGTKYMKTKALQDMADEMLLKEGGNSPVGMSSMMAGASSFARNGLVAGIGGGLATKLVRERGGFMVAAAANKLAESGALERMAGSLKATLEGMGDMGLLGAYKPALELAGAKGAMNLLATHVRLAKTDPKYLPTLGMETENEDAANQYASKAERLGAVKSALDEHDKETELHLARFLGSAPGKKPTYDIIRPSRDDFNARMARINDVLRDPSIIDTSHLAATTPALAMAAAGQAQAAANFLLTKAPKNPGTDGGLKAFDMPWRPSDADLERFYRYIRVVERPIDVLKELNETGRITPEAAETMRTVYPKLLEDTKNMMMQRLLSYDKPLSYEKKRGLDSIFGSEFRGVNPKKLVLLQGLHAASMGKQKSGGSSPDGRQNQSQEDNLETQAQKVEKR